MKIILNGAGRIGRCLIRKIINDKEIELTQINDPFLTAASLCYLINYDSVYGPLKDKFEVIDRGRIRFGNKKIIFSKYKNLYEKNFNKSINFIIDSSGVKKNHEKILKYMMRFFH